ncbi:MAG: hypothetical protein ABSF78_04570 [Candidatus Acidiferrales bacterium]|jgi:hypothetical protein
MPKLIAVVGALVICAGIDLLWQSYAQIQYWFEAYLAFFKAIWRRQLTSRFLVSAKNFAKNQAAVQVLLGLGFVFVLGPLLLFVSLTLILQTR